MSIDGRLICYYLLFVTAVALVLAAAHRQIRRSAACCRRSARTVPAPRPSMATAWWCTAPPPACCRRCLPRWRAMLALWLRYNGPDTSLSVRDHARHPAHRGDRRRHGHDHGSVVGAVLFSSLAQSYLRDLLRLGGDGPPQACPGCRPWLSPRTAGCCGWACCSFCLFTAFPTGVVGRLRSSCAWVG